MSARPEIVYKYTDREGARKIIGNCSFRFARPSEMNDPFDLLIDDLYDGNLAAMQREAVGPMLARLTADPDKFAAVIGISAAEARATQRFLDTLTPQARATFVAELSATDLETHDRELAALRQQLEPQLQGVIAQFKNAAIFCATRNSNNLLMWAHYAEQHRGVVLGFRPDVEHDSFLTVCEPVQYGDARPSFYGPFEDALWSNRPFGQADIAAVRNALVYSKSSHWSYEEEVRIFIPNRVPEGQAAVFLPFYPEELCELYFGCRMDAPSRAELTSLARALNPQVALFDVKTDKSSYALGYDPIPN